VLARQAAAAVGVGTCWSWETAATLPFARRRKALRRPRVRTGAGAYRGGRPPTASYLSVSTVPTQFAYCICRSFRLMMKHTVPIIVTRSCSYTSWQNFCGPEESWVKKYAAAIRSINAVLSCRGFWFWTGASLRLAADVPHNSVRVEMFCSCQSETFLRTVRPSYRPSDGISYRNCVCTPSFDGALTEA